VNSNPRHRFLLLAVLGALSAFGPLSMDLYLPGMPSLAAGLTTTDSLAQLTISACMLGLATGQLLSGPLSDRIGRRRPLVVGVALFTLASLACAAAPTIWLLLVARFVQGFAGAAGIVISRAVVRDLYDEASAARVFSRLVLITGLAPVVAPIAGGALLLFTDWRGVFVVLALIGLVLLAAAFFVVPDSLAVANRHTGGLSTQVAQMGRLLRDRRFTGYALAAGIGGCTLFVYISMSSLVLQRDYGVSPQWFAIIFAINSTGIVIASQINVPLLSRFGPRPILIAAVATALAGSLAATISAWLVLGALFLLIPVFVVVSTQGVQGPNITALVLGPHARSAGSAAAVLGTSQFLVGAIVPPLVSVGGTNALVMAATMLGSSAIAFVVIVTMTRAGNSSRESTPRPGGAPALE
jgi:MFS transporter, DHA1 family, multidrug resistance protein